MSIAGFPFWGEEGTRSISLQWTLKTVFFGMDGYRNPIWGPDNIYDFIRPSHISLPFLTVIRDTLFLVYSANQASDSPQRPKGIQCSKRKAWGKAAQRAGAWGDENVLCHDHVVNTFPTADPLSLQPVRSPSCFSGSPTHKEVKKYPSI